MPKSSALLHPSNQSSLPTNYTLLFISFTFASYGVFGFDCSPVQAPVAAPPTKGTGVNKSDCFGVFCVTYDLKAVNPSLLPFFFLI